MIQNFFLIFFVAPHRSVAAQGIEQCRNFGEHHPYLLAQAIRTICDFAADRPCHAAQGIAVIFSDLATNNRVCVCVCVRLRMRDYATILL